MSHFLRPATGLVLFLSLATPLAAAQAPELAADINQTGDPLSGIPFNNRSVWLEAGGQTTIVASTAATGIELFSVPATGAPSLLRDILPGPLGSEPELGVVLGGVVYFSADDGESGRELWRTDGTPQGTRRLSDVTPGEVPSSPEQLMTDGTRLFATVLDGPVLQRKRRLAMFDLANGQPTFLTTITGANAIEDPRDATAVGAQLVFSGQVGSAGRELCVSGFQADSAQLLLDINPGPADSDPRHFTPFAGHVYFSALCNGDRELWRTDGTVAGTTFVQTIWPERFVASNGVGELTTNGQLLVFTAYDWTAGAELWATDGNAAYLLTDVLAASAVGFPSHLVMHGSDVYFTLQGTGSVGRPWKATTTPFTETQLADVILIASLNAHAFVAHAGRVYFPAQAAGLGTELWSTDGTPAGTQLVADINPGAFTSRPQALTSTSGALLFSAEAPATGRELYAVSGGVAALLADIEPLNVPADSTPRDFARVFARQLFFSADDGIHGHEPWRFDEVNGPVALGDLHPQFDSGARFFTGLWDGVEARVFFEARDPSAGHELHVLDATGVHLVSDVLPGGASGTPRELTAFGGDLYFAARPQADKSELFRTDGTPAGTHQVVASNPIFSGDVRELVAGYEALYFVRTNNQGKRSVYRTDGQSVQAISLPTTIPGLSSIPFGLRFFEGQLIYLTYLASNGEPSLFVYDEALGTTVEWPLPTSTHQIKGIDQPLVHDGRYYFTLELGAVNSEELFSIAPRTGDLRRHHVPLPSVARISSLTSAGEFVYYELTMGFGGGLQSRLARSTAAVDSGAIVSVAAQLAEINELTGLGDRAYFRAEDADDPLLARELLRIGPYDHMETFEVAGSGAVSIPGPGLAHESPTEVTPVGGDLFFAADPLGGPGREVFRLKTPEASVVDFDLPGSGGELRIQTPNLGTSVSLNGFTPIVGGLTAVVVGAPADPYALPGAIATDAACIAGAQLQLVGIFGAPLWSTQVQVPASPSLIGARFAMQGVTVDIQTPNAPLRLTNAKLLTLGL